MRQFLIPREKTPATETDNSTLTLDKQSFHYLIRVLRYEKGASFPALDHNGNIYHATITGIKKETVSMQLKRSQNEGRDTNNYTNNVQIILFQCLPKGKKMDTIIRQATESGVAEIRPLISEHSISRPDKQSLEGKTLRWEKITVEATQQSGRSLPPQIFRAKPLINAQKEMQNISLGIFFHQSPLENKSLHRYLSNIPQNDSVFRIGIVIGPEGGLSQKEISFLREQGFKPGYLGPQVLRTETAPIYAIGAIQTIVLEKHTWQYANE